MPLIALGRPYYALPLWIGDSIYSDEKTIEMVLRRLDLGPEKTITSVWICEIDKANWRIYDKKEGKWVKRTESYGEQAPLRE